MGIAYDFCRKGIRIKTVGKHDERKNVDNIIRVDVIFM